MFSDLLTKTLCAIMASANSLSIKSTSYGESSLGVRIRNLGGGKRKIKDIVHEITHEIHKDLSSAAYDGKNIKDKMIL